MWGFEQHVQSGLASYEVAEEFIYAARGRPVALAKLCDEELTE
jgi:hypothetical protein